MLTGLMLQSARKGVQICRKENNTIALRKKEKQEAQQV